MTFVIIIIIKFYISHAQVMCCWLQPSCPTRGLLTKSSATFFSLIGREKWSPAEYLLGPIWISLRCWLMLPQ